MNKKLTSATHIAVFVVYTMLTASIVSAQTGGGERPPASFWWPERTHTADAPLCEWENTNSDPAVARACLQAAGVNIGLGAYAFPFTPEDAAPGGSGAYGEGLVTRWAMVAALMQAVEQVVNYADEPGVFEETVASFDSLEFTDVGWLNEEQQQRISQAAAGVQPITTGVRTQGGTPRFEADQPVTRAQMALFFVRTLLYMQNAGSTDTLSSNLQNLREWWDSVTADPPYFFADIAWYPDRQIGWDDEIIRAVHVLYHLGVTEGTHTKTHEGNTYHFYSPSSHVTGDQMALFVVRLLAHAEFPPFDAAPEPPADAGSPGSFVHSGQNRNVFGWEKAPEGEEIVPYPSTRPPREIDIYRYQTNEESTENAGIYMYGEMLTVGEPANLQIGDWWWSASPGHGDWMQVVVAFRTSRDFYPGNLEMTRFYTCTLEGGKLKGNAFGSALYLRSAPGVFRKTNTGEAGVPELDCRSLLPPAPEGGYTRNYPCDAGASADRHNRRYTNMFSNSGEPLPACGT